MKYIFAITSLFLTSALFGQLADGTVAPNWTLSDINGNSYTLDSLLNQGKTVILNFSATWCDPCWKYHTTEALQDFYDAHGPDGDNTACVFLIESECNNNIACLYDRPGCRGQGEPTGDWVTRTPYPIIDNCSLLGSYQIEHFPTIYLICPQTKKIYELGQAPQDYLERIMAQVCVLDR